MANKPLQGVKVLDFTQLLPGPMCTLHLADMGADVLKLEQPGTGDPGRGPAGTAISHFFQVANRNKRSLAINLRAPGAREIVLKLVAQADILVEGFRPDVMARLGLGYAAVRTANDKIVYCAITGYGQDGPFVDMGGHDINYQSYAGILEQSAAPGGKPHPGNFPPADLAGGTLSAAMAILAALFDAQRSGKGRFLDVSMTDCALAHNVGPLAAMHTYGQAVPAGSDVLTGGLPCYGTYATQDGRYLAVGALEPKFWKAFCETIARPDLIAKGWSRGKEGQSVHAQIVTVIQGKTLAQWNEAFAGVDACVSPVLSIAEVLHHPLTQARRMLVNMAAPDGKSYDYFAFPVKMSDYEFSVERLPPSLGQHNEDVLRSLGYSDTEITALRSQGVV